MYSNRRTTREECMEHERRECGTVRQDALPPLHRAHIVRRIIDQSICNLQTSYQDKTDRNSYFIKIKLFNSSYPWRRKCRKALYCKCECFYKGVVRVSLMSTTCELETPVALRPSFERCGCRREAHIQTNSVHMQARRGSWRRLMYMVSACTEPDACPTRRRNQ